MGGEGRGLLRFQLPTDVFGCDAGFLGRGAVEVP